MYEENVLQELFDGILRSLFVAWLFMLAAGILQPRIARCGREYLDLAHGAFFGFLTIATMIIHLPVTVGHTVDLRALPIIFAAPVAGMRASALTVGLAVAGQLTVAETLNGPGLATITVAALVGWGVAYAMGWRFSAAASHVRALTPTDVILLMAGTIGSAILPETPIFSPTAAYVEVTSSWLLYFAFLPGAALIIGGILIDLARRREIDRRLRAEADRVATIAENVPGVLYQRTKDSSGRPSFRYMSRGAQEMFGLSPQLLMADASEFYSRVHPLDRSLVFSALDRAQRNPSEPVVCEFRVVRPDGQTVWIQTRSRISRELSSQLGYPVSEGMAIDITTRKIAEANADEARRLMYYATDHDQLTGLPNRQGLSHVVAELSGASSYPYLIALVDFRASSLVNELFGASGGDERLIEAARRLKAAAPDDSIVSRTGDDEFTIYVDLLSDIGSPEGIINCIVEAIGQPFHLSGQSVPMQADVGYAVSDASLGEWDGVLRAASTALDEARAQKEAGTVRFTPELQTQRTAQREFDARLAVAVASDKMTVFWQPICATSNAGLLGREALVRWMQPDGNLVLPGKFVPRVEAMGLWPKFDSYMLHRACEEAGKWDNDLWISVNLSPGWFMVGNLLDEVRSALDASGLAAERLCIEVTERALIEDHVLASQQIEQLRNMGVSVAIDDFGSGYSSFSYLSRLPIRKLKIDKSFIDDLEHSARARDVVENIIELCTKWSIMSVAEGVENEAQWNWLRSHGCVAVQGYYIGKPERL